MNDLLELIRSLRAGMWRHRWGALFTGALVGLSAATAIFALPDRYEAAARIQVDSQSILKPLMSGLAIQPDMHEQMRMMSRTLMSRPNVDRVAALSGFDQPADTVQARERLVDDLGRRVQLNAAGGVNLYALSFRDGDPKLALRVVEALVTVFVEANLGSKRRDSEQARKFIEEQIVIYEKRLAEAEDALKDFKIRHLGTMPGAAAQDFVGRAAEARLDLEAARGELRQAEGSRDALKRELAMEAAVPAAAIQPPPAARITETDIRLQDARKRLDDLRIRFTSAHPDVISVTAAIERLEALKRTELEADARRGPSDSLVPTPGVGTSSAYSVIRASLAETEARVAALRARVASAQAKLGSIERSAQTVPKVEAELVQLNRDYEINKKNYEQLLARRESASMSNDMESSAGVNQYRVIDPPRVTNAPVSPNRFMLLGAALLSSIGAGIGFAFLRYQITPSFQSANELSTEFDLPLLGTVSMVSTPALRRQRRMGSVTFTTSTAAYLAVFLLMIAFVAIRPGAVGPVKAQISAMLGR
jgi:polysaccharide chain length determinant protein (PEP-CTERM system associated)